MKPQADRGSKRDKAIMALLTQPTIQEAAKSIGISDTTLWRWMQEEEFSTRYKEAKQLAFNQAMGRLQQVSSIAVDTLQSVMEDETAPPSSRVSAAKTVLELSHKSFEIQELAEKIAELERLANA